MKRTFLLLIVLMMLLSGVTSATHITIDELIERPGAYDGVVVVIQGEVVGDVMVRGEHAWINVADDTGVLGVFAPSRLVKGLVPGRYSMRGDQVVIRGVFNRSCVQHGGDMDIHAEAIELVEQHQPITTPIEQWKVWLSAALALVYSGLLLERYVFKSGRSSDV